MNLHLVLDCIMQLFKKNATSGAVCNLLSFSCPLTPFQLDTVLKVLNGRTDIRIPLYKYSYISFCGLVLDTDMRCGTFVPSLLSEGDYIYK